MNDLMAAIELAVIDWEKRRVENQLDSMDLIQELNQVIDNFDEDDMLMDALVRKYKSIEAKNPEYDENEIDLEVLDDIRAKLHFIN